jgi:hypothetical protein
VKGIASAQGCDLVGGRVFALRPASPSPILRLAGSDTDLGFLPGPLPARLNYNVTPLPRPEGILAVDFLQSTIAILR